MYYKNLELGEIGEYIYIYIFHSAMHNNENPMNSNLYAHTQSNQNISCDGPAYFFSRSQLIHVLSDKLVR